MEIVMEFFQTNHMHLYIAIFLSVLNGTLLAFLSTKFLQVLQQAGYKMKGYITWLRGTRYKYLSRLFTLALLSGFCALVTNTLLDVYHKETLFSYIGLVFYFYFAAVFIINLVKEPNKVPLVKTKRIGRLFGLLFLIYSGLTFILIALSTEFLLLLRFGIITLTPILVPFVVMFGFYLILPLELLINAVYVFKAKRKLKKMPHLLKIGITGSFAKTSNKFILEKMLSKKYKTLSSPHSYNTPLGLTRVILQQLNPSYEVFIAELGAKKVGEIKELCQFIKPHHGILTSIGTQHLETFKTQENIAKTKFELADYIKNGFMIFNGDSAKCLEMFNKEDNPNRLLSFGSENKSGDAYCENVVCDENGTKFTLVLGDKKINCQTKLLGKHVCQNIAMCALLSFNLGVSVKDIKAAISELEAPKHRLEIVASSPELIVIDDSFNASVEGAKASLEVLGLFKDFKKVIITPGIVEMGKLETDANFNFGKEIAKVCDWAIVVNEINKAALQNGMLENGMKEENILYCENLAQANEKLKALELDKAVVLFENDLPDLFAY